MKSFNDALPNFVRHYSSGGAEGILAIREGGGPPPEGALPPQLRESGAAPVAEGAGKPCEGGGKPAEGPVEDHPGR